MNTKLCCLLDKIGLQSTRDTYIDSTCKWTDGGPRPPRWMPQVPKWTNEGPKLPRWRPQPPPRESQGEPRDPRRRLKAENLKFLKSN